MVKHSQTIRRQKSTNYLSVFDHLVRLVLKRFEKEINQADFKHGLVKCLVM